MTIYAKPLERLIKELSRLPGIGERTASRLAFHILKLPKEDARSLANSIIEAQERIGLCPECFNLSEEGLCVICANGGRSRDILCVVEKVNDLISIERGGGFKGRYHVLHGVLSPIHGIGPEKIKIKGLLDRVDGEEIKEVILATNPSTEGEATALYISKLLKPLGVKVSRIAFGVPMGGDLEYIDGVTLSRALEGRQGL